MPSEPSPDDLIAEALAALASPVRLRLLRAIREPRALREIEVQTTRSEVERTMSRQSVREHLDKLIDAGVVVVREADRSYGATQEFLVNHQAIYALGEEVRALARVRSMVEPLVIGAFVGEVNLEIVVFERAADGRLSFIAPTPDGLVRTWLPKDALEPTPRAIEGVEVRTVSPLTLYQIRKGVEPTFGGMRPKDRVTQAALRKRFFADVAEAELAPSTETLREILDIA